MAVLIGSAVASRNGAWISTLMERVRYAHQIAHQLIV